MRVHRSIDWQFDKSRNVAAIQCYGSSTPWFVCSLCGNDCVETGRVHGCTSTPSNVHQTQPNSSINGAKRSLRPLSVLNTIRKFNSRRKAQPRAFICIQRIIIRFWLPQTKCKISKVSFQKLVVITWPIIYGRPCRRHQNVSKTMIRSARGAAKGVLNTSSKEFWGKMQFPTAQGSQRPSAPKSDDTHSTL